MKATARRATLAETILINALLLQHLEKDQEGKVRVEDGGVRYLMGWSDDKIAHEAKANKRSVQRIRQKLFGNVRQPNGAVQPDPLVLLEERLREATPFTSLEERVSEVEMALDRLAPGWRSLDT